ncbi:hypothetical protein SeMB42_g00047 [Synchytrium endobioticum]|uniref:30S ribosomal protein S8 n=1 Tax=Synchytrium endobioticum TaxID=286115 RepID=A0A507D7D8_9FUNG|nr:hypothetical protein SeLEV6574_g02708 [Synchytrium endobioticum]TPX55012.1 hypothetical protein SeMB42_g00047 [Synchytrium endobioticum]
MAPYHHLCSQIENSFRWKLRRIAVPSTKTNRAICQILYYEGFLSSIATGNTKGPYAYSYNEPVTPDNVAEQRLWLDLKYRDGLPAMNSLRVVSKPSRRVSLTADQVKLFAGMRRASPLIKPMELGQVTILKTPAGIVEISAALKYDMGGEILCIAK